MRKNIIQMLSRINENFKEYTGMDMMADEILDSFAVMEFIAELEELYHIEIDADDIVAENFKTVDSIAELIEKYVGTGK